MKVSADWLRDPDVLAVTRALTEAGFDAFFVGGCVRNALIGGGATDIDIATNARPDDTIKAAKSAGLKTIPTGKDHGTITVVSGGVGFEVTTYRRDVETDGRRAVVAFADTIAEDALRRDFTMNALYADSSGAVFDPVGGLDDLRARRVRFIEDPVRRIAEDRLRALRFFRFHAWYGDKDAGLDPDALAAIADAVDGLPELSNERVGVEVKKLLSAPDPVQAAAALENCGALGQIMPGATTRWLGSVVLLEAYAGLSPDWLRRLVSLGGVDVKEALRLSNTDAQRIQAFSKAFGAPLAEVAYKFGKDTAWDVAIIDASQAQQPLPADTSGTIERGARATFPVKASDLPDLNGKPLGDRLKELEARWIESDFTLSKSNLLA
ncbi:MAG: CCA tRNA nucleotidyltransferase [Pseudomonadota bacterium]